MPTPNLSSKSKKKSRRHFIKKNNSNKKIPNSINIFITSIRTFKTHWRVLGGITLVYALLSVILVQSSTNLSSIDEQISSSRFSQATNDFSNLINGFSTGDSLIQFVLFLMLALALVWAVRRLLAGEQVSTKQAYYQAMTPIVPVLILIILFFIQLLPMLLASAGLQFAFGGGLSATAIESLAWIIVFILASWWSLRMISRTIIAIFIVTLPGMMPLQAMKKAKELVKGRRFSITRKLLFLPIAILFILGMVLIPVIMVASILASPLFMILGPLSVSISLLYLFTLYQEIIE